MLTPPFHRAVNIRWYDSTTAYTICTGALCRAPLEQCKWFQAMRLWWIRNKRRTRTVWGRRTTVWRRRTVVHGCREFVKCKRMHDETLLWCSDEEEVRILWCYALCCCWIYHLSRIVGVGWKLLHWFWSGFSWWEPNPPDNLAQLHWIYSQEICMLMQTCA
jgi:hypothetical protein